MISCPATTMAVMMMEVTMYFEIPPVVHAAV